MKPKVQPMRKAPAKKIEDSSESEFDRSRAPMRGKWKIYNLLVSLKFSHLNTPLSII